MKNSTVSRTNLAPETTLTQTAPARSTAEPTRHAPLFQPHFDITENENEITLYGDLRGVNQDDLVVRYENEQLIIGGRIAARNEGLQVLR